jgi:hypothetical protein
MTKRVDRRLVASTVLVLALGLLPPSAAVAQGGGPPKAGLVLNTPGACPGYTLLAPLGSTKTYLIDLQGRVVKTWTTDCAPASCAYLLENGHLLRPGTLGREGLAFGPGPAAGGRVQEFTWDGALVWDFKLFNEKQMPTHDITPMPNGHVLMIVWDKKSAKEVIAAGRRPETVGSYLLPDSIVEVQPTGKTTGKIVWEWHLWDHLIQDFDKTKANYGNVAEHPELVDLNYAQDYLKKVARGKNGDKLKGIGYVGSPTARKQRVSPDWTHANSVAYNAELDQVMLSVHTFSEIWVIDHGTTSAEAAGHNGGRHGKGGDLIYRWGNPRTYRAGTVKDQKLFGQHTAHWIAGGQPGAGHLLLFNNGMGRPGSYSSVEELVLPADTRGSYAGQTGHRYGPDGPVWIYTTPKKTDFYSMVISGAQRLPNGNTLVCAGTTGTVFEVTPAKEVVWKYINLARGVGPFGGPPMGIGRPTGRVELVPSFLRGRLKLGADQKDQLAALERESEARLNKILTETQRKQLKQMRESFARGGFGMPGFGPIGSSLFRAYRYGPDYPGLAGRKLTPGKTVEELERQAAK